MSIILPSNQKTSHTGFYFWNDFSLLAAEVRTPHTDFLQLAGAGTAVHGGLGGQGAQSEEIRSLPWSAVIEKSEAHLWEGLAWLPSATTIALVLFSFSNVPCGPVSGFKIAGGE